MSTQQPSSKFSLNSNFLSYLDWAYGVDHEQAISHEIDKLKPLFEGLVEYVQGVVPSVNFLHSRQYKKFLDAEAYKNLSVADLEKAFRSYAVKKRSFMTSDIVITDYESVEDGLDQYYYNLGTDGAYGGHYSVIFPSVMGLRNKGGWGSVQIYRPETSDRITLPFQALDNSYKIDQLLAGNDGLVCYMQNIARITNHDWIHHLTMHDASQRIVHTEYPWYGPLPMTELHDRISVSSSVKLGCNGFLEILEQLGLSDRRSNDKYETLLVQTHANVLRTDAARALRESLQDNVDMLTDNIYHLFNTVSTRDIEELDQFKALNYLALKTAKFLRRVEPIQAPMTKDFLTNVFSMGPKGNSHLREAQQEVWQIQGAGTPKELFEQAVMPQAAQNLQSGYVKIFEDTPLSRGARQNAADLAAVLKAHL